MSKFETTKSSFEISREQDLTLDGFFEIDTRLTNDLDQTVESVKLLGEDGIHTLLIQDWIFLLSGWDIESAWHLSEDSVGQFVDEVLTTTAASSSGAGLGNEDSLES